MDVIGLEQESGWTMRKLDDENGLRSRDVSLDFLMRRNETLVGFYIVEEAQRSWCEERSS